MRLELLDPVVTAAPGETASCRMRVVNDGTTPATYQLRVVGLRDEPIRPDGGQQLEPGESIDLEMDVRLPRAFAAGRHQVAVEVSSDQKGERPSLTPLMIEVGSIQQVSLDAYPSTIKGHRKGRFKLEINNREDHPVHLVLGGHGPDVSVKVKPAEIDLPSGGQQTVKGVVRAPRRLVRDPVLRTLTLTASGHAAPVAVQTSFRQRPWLPRRLRVFMVVLVIVAFWAALLLGGVYLWHQHNTKSATATAPTTTVAGANGAAPGADGSTTATTTPGGAANGANGSAAPGAPGAAAPPAKKGPAKPTATVVKGTVKAGATGANGGIQVLLTPAKLGTTPTPGTSGQAGSDRPVKIWPARHGTHTPVGVSALRETVSVQTSDAGAWAFPNVALGAAYELHFSKAGFDSQSVIITPTPDGKPVSVPPVVLLPAIGAANGVVNGPGGPLGGVTIVITDGTLTYQTTTATDAAKLGTWSMSQISTPGNYTITATLRGYGTQVQQLSLAPGQQAKNLTISMQQGVGSIGGKVLQGTAPFGGVTITASAGKSTATTTTLTVGDQGSYLLPDLSLSAGPWTVTATAPGHVAQSVQIDLSQDANPTNVNFTLKSTTATVRGLVVSSKNGPLPAAGVTISHDKLAYRTTTAATPTPGSFEIDGLAPGDYVITLDRFDHDTLSEPITLAAGDDLDLGTISMAYHSQTLLTASGEIDLGVQDTQGTPLTGSSVQLLLVSSGQVVQTINDTTKQQSSFAFTKVAIGTYNVQISRANYRTTTRRVSVGLGVTNLGNIQLLKLGQVLGHVVDAFDPTKQLDNYEFQMYRVLPSGALDAAPLQRVVFNVNSSTGDIFFQSDPSSLTDGTYQFVVTKSPPGYQIKSDQIIDPNNATAKPMQFTINPTDENTIDLKDLKAYPFPSLQGRLLVAKQLDANGNIQPASLPGTQSGTKVTLDCGTGSTPASAVLSESSPGVSGFDTFAFSSQLIATNSLVGACTVTVVSPGYATATDPVPSPLAVSDGVTRTDQFMNIAVAKPTSVAGGLRWFDYGVTSNQEQAIPGATVAATTQVITGFAPGTGSLNGQATPIRSSVSPAVTDSSGGWTVLGQIFGTSPYSVTAAGFTDGTFDVAIDQNGAIGTPANTGLESATSNGSALSLTMAPTSRSLPGTVRLVTTNPSPADPYPIDITPTGPDPSTKAPGHVGTVVAPTAASSGSFSIASARPGTWSVIFAPHAGYVLQDPANPTTFVSSVTQNRTLSPTGALPTPLGVDLVELASVDLQVKDSSNAPLDVTESLSRTDVVTAVGSGTVLGTGHYSFPNLAVKASQPAVNAASYELSISASGFDLASATVTVDGSPVSHPDLAHLALALKAGRHAQVVVVLPRLGSITGLVTGVVDTRGTQEKIPFANLTITAQRTLDTSGNPVSDAPVTVTEVTDPTQIPNTATQVRFSFTGLPGTYSVSVSAPNYGAPTAPSAATFVMSNSQAVQTGLYTLPLKAGSIVLQVQDALFRPLSGSTVTITDLTTNQAIDASRVSDTGATGLFPGAYTVMVRYLDLNGADTKFPAKITVSVPRGDGTQNVRVATPLLDLGGKILGTVVAQNNAGRAMPLPATVTVSRTFKGSTVSVNSTVVANQATEGDLGAAAPATSQVLTQDTPADKALNYEFDGVEVGKHDISFSTATGYTKPGTKTSIDADLAGAVMTPATYMANDVTVTVHVVTAINGATSPVDTAHVQLVPNYTDINGNPQTDIPIPLTHTSNGNYVSSAVPPEQLDYTVQISDSLNTFTDAPLTVAISATGTLSVTETMSASGTRLDGLLQKQDSPGRTVAFGGQTLALWRVGPSGESQVRQSDGITPVTATTANDGTYHFSVDTAGNYRVKADITSPAPGYAPNLVDISNVALGQPYTLPSMTVLKYGTLTFNLVGPDGSTPIPGSANPTAVLTVNGNHLAACTMGGTCDFTRLDSNASYSWTFSATNYYDVSYPGGNTTFAPAVGSTGTPKITFAQRVVTVPVGAEGDASKTIAAGATIAINGTTVTAPSDPVGTHTVTGAPMAAGTIAVSATGYRTNSAALPVQSPAGPASVANVPVSILKLATVSGTINVSGGGTVPADVSVQLVGASTRSTTTTAGGGYSFGNVDIGTYTVQVDPADKHYIASGSVTVSATSTSNDTGHDLTATVKTANFTFTVSDSGGNVSGASVTFNGVSKTTDVNGQTSFNGVSVLATMTYSVTAVGHVNFTGTADPDNPGTSVTMALEPSFSGTAQINRLTTGNDHLTVYMCAPSVSTCDTTHHTSTVTPNSNGSFTVALTPATGRYHLFAADAFGNSSPTQNLDLAQTGVMSPTTATLRVPVTPVNFAFTVTVGATAVVGASVTFDGTTTSTDSSGVAKFDTILVTDPMAFTVTKSGDVDYAGTADPQNPATAVPLAAVPSLTGAARVNGAGVSGLTVYRCNPGASQCDTTHNAATATSGAGGSYTLPFTSATGVYQVFAADANGNTSAVSNVSLAQDGTLNPSPLNLNVSLPFVFTVTSGGTAVQGATVTLGNLPSTPTLADGTATFNSVPSSFGYTVTKTGYVDYAGTTTASGTAIAVSLATVPSLTGTTQSNGVATAGLTVYLCAPSTSPCSTTSNDGSTTSTAGGSYSIPFGSATGAYKVFAVDASGNFSPKATVSLAQGGGLTPGTQTLNVLVPFEFTVTDAGGAPVSGAAVKLGNLGPTNTDATGKVTFSTVPLSFGYTVTKSGYVDGSGTTTVAGGAIAVTIGLIPAVTGTTSVGGTATNGVTVYWCAPSVTLPCTTANASGSTNSSSSNGTGSYSITLTHVPGTYTLFAKNGGTSSATQTVTLNQDGTTSGSTLNFNI